MDKTKELKEQIKELRTSIDSYKSPSIWKFWTANQDRGVLEKYKEMFLLKAELRGRQEREDEIVKKLGKARRNNKCKECDFNFKLYQEIKESWRTY